MEGSAIMADNVKTITKKIEGEQWQKILDKSFKKNSKNLKVDGFRKGNIPKDIFLKKYGIEPLYSDAIDYLLKEIYPDVLKENESELACQPSAEVKKISKDAVEVEFTLISRPKVKLGKYKDLKVKKDNVEVTEEEIDKNIENIRANFAEIKAKDGDIAELNDVAVIDFKGTIDGKAFDGGSDKNYSLTLGSNTFIPGFEEGIVGMKVGETKVLHLQFPDTYYKELAGKKVDFEVTLNELKTRVLPELNEEFYEDLGYEKVSNEKELREEIRNVLTQEREIDAENKYTDEVLKKASDNLEVEINEEIIDEEIKRVVDQLKRKLDSNGYKIEDYLTVTGLTKKEFDENTKTEAISRIKMRYLLEEIAEAENITVSEEEVEENAQTMADNYGISKEELIKAYGNKDVIKYDIKMHKALEFLKNN